MNYDGWLALKIDLGRLEKVEKLSSSGLRTTLQTSSAVKS